jgi:hypothetical protein
MNRNPTQKPNRVRTSKTTGLQQLNDDCCCDRLKLFSNDFMLAD